jgi:hypothetical protein
MLAVTAIALIAHSFTFSTNLEHQSVQPEWIPYNDGLTDATMVMDLAITSTNKLRLGTHGKGL